MSFPALFVRQLLLNGATFLASQVNIAMEEGTPTIMVSAAPTIFMRLEFAMPHESRRSKRVVDTQPHRPPDLSATNIQTW